MWFIEVCVTVRGERGRQLEVRRTHTNSESAHSRVHRRASWVANPAGDGLSGLIGVLTQNEMVDAPLPSTVNGGDTACNNRHLCALAQMHTELFYMHQSPKKSEVRITGLPS